MTPEFRAFQPHPHAARFGRILAFLGFLGLSLLVMAANGSVTATSVSTWYQALRQPPGTPPDWLFAPVWTILYVLIGVSAALVWSRVEVAAERKRAALRCWGWQLAANALWPAAFFGLRQPALGLPVILVLLALILLTIRRFAPIRPVAAWMLVPYAAWVSYATYLNAGVWWLNG